MKRIAVVGAGLMGSGIAQVCASVGLNVTMIDISQSQIDLGLKTIADSLDRLIAKQKISDADRKTFLSRIRTGLDFNGLGDVDLAIEAATENVEAKLGIMRKLSDSVDPSAIIATNTSSISITQLAEAVADPARFLGLHFFNPVPVMSLVEIVRGLQTSDEAHAEAIDFVKSIGKTPITALNRPGFAVNRILCPMLNEAIFAVQENVATAEDIDTGMKLGCNHPIGPLALADLIGLDTLLAVMNMFYADFGDPKYRAPVLLKEMVAAGHLGRKSGRGFYQYR